MDIMSDTFLSEDSPEKQEPKVREVRGRFRSSTPRTFLTPRSSPSPSPSPRGRKGVSRASSLKRSSSTPISIPTMPRRGRAAVSPAEMWGDSGRMVHRKVDHPDEASAEQVLKNVVEQLAADRAAMAQMYSAIQAVAKVVNQHDDGMTALDGRLEEQTRMRLDDHRLHIGAINHVRTGVEDLARSNIKISEYVDVQDKATHAELAKKLQEIHSKVDEALPQIIEAKFISIKSAIDQLHTAEEEMKAYIIELEKARPEEGRMVFTAFTELKQEVSNLKAAQQEQAVVTTGLSHATAAGLSGLAASGVASGLSATHLSALDTMKAQIETLTAAEQSRPCHCGDVGSNTTTCRLKPLAWRRALARLLQPSSL